MKVRIYLTGTNVSLLLLKRPNPPTDGHTGGQFHVNLMFEVWEHGDVTKKMSDILKTNFDLTTGKFSLTAAQESKAKGNKVIKC